MIELEMGTRIGVLAVVVLCVSFALAFLADVVRDYRHSIALRVMMEEYDVGIYVAKSEYAECWRRRTVGIEPIGRRFRTVGTVPTGRGDHLQGRKPRAYGDT